MWVLFCVCWIWFCGLEVLVLGLLLITCWISGLLWCLVLLVCGLSMWYVLVGWCLVVGKSVGCRLDWLFALLGVLVCLWLRLGCFVGLCSRWFPLFFEFLVFMCL